MARLVTVDSVTAYSKAAFVRLSGIPISCELSEVAAWESRIGQEIFVNLQFGADEVYFGGIIEEPLTYYDAVRDVRVDNSGYHTVNGIRRPINDGMGR